MSLALSAFLLFSSNVLTAAEARQTQQRDSIAQTQQAAGPARAEPSNEQERAAAVAGADAAQSEAADGPSLKTGYIIIANGSKDHNEALGQFDEYRDKGYPRHGEYPQLMQSGDIQGLNPGFWIVVAGIAKDKKVANELSRFLRALGLKSYIREVQVTDPEDMRLVVIERSEAVMRPFDGHEFSPDRGKVGFFSLHERLPIFVKRGKSDAMSPTGRVAIPFVLGERNSSIVLGCDATRELVDKWRYPGYGRPHCGPELPSIPLNGIAGLFTMKPSDSVSKIDYLHCVCFFE